MRIYLLLPRSNMFPTLGNDFIKGLKLAFEAQSKVTPEFVVESIGNGTDLNIVQRAEKYLLEDSIDIAIGFAGIEVIPSLIERFDAYQKPFIHVDLGANYTEYYKTSDYVLHHTLNLWQSCYATGKHMVEQHGKNIALATSFYDGGYQLLDAVFRGVMDAGGTVVNNYVSPMEYSSEDFEKYHTELEATDADAVFSIFSYKEGATFLKSANFNIPFYSLPMLVDPHSLGDLKLKENTVHSIATWSFHQNGNANVNAILNSYKSKHNKAFNIISMLAYESAEIILSSLNDEHYVINNIVGHLRNKEIVLPRGLFTVNDANETQINEFVVRTLSTEGDPVNKCIDKIDNNVTNPYSEEQLEMITGSGWKNPYICT